MKVNQKELNFIQDGLQTNFKFLSKEQIEALRTECNKLFSFTKLLGPGYAIRLSKFVLEIPNPTVIIESVNLLEVAIDIAIEIEKLGYKNYKFAHVALYHENKNNKELVWHSDLRNGGLIRAQIVIEGGDLNSGAFKYVTGSQVLKIKEPFPPKGYLEQHKDEIVICNKPNGTLFLINTIGYHSKCVCNDTRVSLMFDFLPAEYVIANPNDVSAEILLSSSRLTTKVLDNIELFRNGVKSNTKSVNTADFYKFYKPFAGSNFKDVFKVFKFFVLKKFGKS